LLNCNKCLLPDDYPGVNLDDDGVCNYCKTGWPKTELLPVQELRDIFSSEKGAKYDCISFLSGGLDSSYQLYLARKEFNLKVVAINYNNGFAHKLAVENQEKLCKELDVDLIRFSSKSQCETNFLKHYIMATANSWNFWGICRPCQQILSLIYNDINIRGRTPFVLAGINMYEKDMEKRYRYKKFTIFFKQILKIPIYKWPASLVHVVLAWKNLSKLSKEYKEFSEQTFEVLGPKEFTGENGSQATQYLDMSKYFSWDIFYVQKLLEENTGWRAPDDHPLPMRFDCRLEALAAYRHKTAYGLTDYGRIYSNCIRAGLITREDIEDDFHKVEDFQLIKESTQEILDELK